MSVITSDRSTCVLTGVHVRSVRTHCTLQLGVLSHSFLFIPCLSVQGILLTEVYKAIGGGAHNLAQGSDRSEGAAVRGYFNIAHVLTVRTLSVQGILPTEVYKAIGGGAHNLAPGVTAAGGLLCEVVLTTVLVLTVLMTAVDPKTKSSLAPLSIGFAVTVDILAG